MIKVVNKRVHQSVHGDVYIGRPGTLGNPFVMKTEAQRSSVISRYRDWLREEYKKRGEVYTILNTLASKHKRGENIQLVCWCAPKPCHGDVVKDAIEKIADILP